MAQSGSRRETIIAAIGSPLGFFVLALLIVEAFIGTVLLGAKLGEAMKMQLAWAGVALFVVVTGAVFALVWYKPENLTYDKEAHLLNAGKIPFGSDSQRIDPTQRFSQKQIETSESNQ